MATNRCKTEGNLIYLSGIGARTSKKTKASANLDNRRSEEASLLPIEYDGGNMKIRNRKYEINGKTYSISGNTEQEVAEKYARYHAESQKQHDPAQADHDFVVLADKWLKFKIDSKRISSKTAKDYKTHVGRLKQYFQGSAVEDIDRLMVQRFFDQFMHQSERTNKYRKVILQQILDWAVQDRIIETNPAKDKRIILKGNPENARKAVTEEDLRRIRTSIPSLKADPDRFFMALLANTAMRKQEALALRWEDIDWEKRFIKVDKAISFVGNTPVLKGPKSKAGNRVLPLDPMLAAILEPHKKASGYIVSKDGKSITTQSTFKHMWNRIKKQVDLKDYTPHCFRHGIASLLASDPQTPLKGLQTYLGHADFNTTFNTYAKTEDRVITDIGRIFTQRLA